MPLSAFLFGDMARHASLRCGQGLCTSSLLPDGAYSNFNWKIDVRQYPGAQFGQNASLKLKKQGVCYI